MTEDAIQEFIDNYGCISHKTLRDFFGWSDSRTWQFESKVLGMSLLRAMGKQAEKIAHK